MEPFKQLTQESLEKLLDAPALVTILIGASDNNLDGEERTWSEKLLRARSFSGRPELQDYYRVVAESFWVKLQHELNSLPVDVSKRNEEIKRRLSELNPILSSLDHKIAYLIYKGLIGLAEETAKASGGFLRIGAVSTPEYEWVKLPMIKAIAQPKDFSPDDPDRFDANIWGEKPEEQP
ncbi:MAG: hypothetical protein JNJ57_18685 [Saprospiraceae bacterium]|nr:hypothetical protein [Saprospiraceae bacterium]